MTLAHFQDFEEFQLRYNYQQYTAVFNRQFDDMVEGDDDAFFRNLDAEALENPGPCSVNIVADNPPKDIILGALALADARRCDECNYTFTSFNGPEVFHTCGHLVCNSCWTFVRDITGGLCSQCYVPPTPAPPTPATELLEEFVSAQNPTPRTSVIRKTTRALTTPRQDIPNYEDDDMFLMPPPTTPKATKAKTPKKVTPKNKGSSPSRPSPSRITRCPTDPSKVIVSFPQPVEFIVNEGTDAYASSGRNRYAITADSVTLGMDKNLDAPGALQLLKNVRIKNVKRGSAEKNANGQKQKKPKTDPAQLPTLLIGTQGQIQRIVRWTKSNPPMPKASATASAMPPGPTPISIYRPSSSSSSSSSQGQIRVIRLPQLSNMPQLNLASTARKG